MREENGKEFEALFRRAEDLAERAERSGSVTHTGFLTPAESYALSQRSDLSPLLHGGGDCCERQCAFFLPDWMPAEDFDPAEYLCAIEIKTPFGSPEHRDYMGAILGLGIGREWIGDITVREGGAWLFCLPSVKEHLLLNLDKVGRWGVKAREAALSEAPAAEREYREIRFSVQSPRLDAVCAGMFRLSRTAAAETIAAGLVNLNYQVCLKPDAALKEGDILSLRGRGKGKLLSAGDTRSKKGRLFVTAGMY